ncbi:proteasome assembly chaperone family protein [Halalkalicoccus sp. NIPERK01]|uniref:proteasome assembly chaperone family protein n=1 Tax=Halalkalicoccus sp. NIPERK01 TaxID=3053469 RepID=UPI00256F234F|nr:PAC2 family protein [Halalkalicoccus sp. NIPERK01]MDL5361407.1 PAC2 family protein [Halalkalicoccus sp. NIPERK01]
MAQNPVEASFRVTHEAGETGDTLLVGLSQFGLAGLTAVDYLTTQLDLEETGHITAKALPSITPFAEGRPRHHTRLYSRSDLDITVLVGELFVPVQAADPFSRAILGWTDRNAIDEVAVLSGIPLAHGPEDHRTFYIATEDYHRDRLEGTDVDPMGMGFLDGVNASLVERGMDTDLGVGVFVTPVHAQTPDAEAALRLLSTLKAVYDLDFDTGPLEAFASEVQNHYAQLSERLEAAETHERPDDRMFM